MNTKKKIYRHKKRELNNQPTQNQQYVQEQNLLHLKMAHHQQRALIVSKDYQIQEDDEKTDSGSDQESYEEDYSAFLKYKLNPKRAPDKNDGTEGKVLLPPWQAPGEEKATKDPQVETALEFLNVCKQIFHNEPDKCKEMVKALRMSTDTGCSLAEQMARLKELMKGQPLLLSYLNKFLPNSLKVHSYELEAVPTTSGEERREPMRRTRKRELSEDEEEEIEGPLTKKSSLSFRDTSYARLGQVAFFKDIEFFDKVRAALSDKYVYQNFLRIMDLYNNEFITAKELYESALQVLGRFPELCQHLKNMLKIQDGIISFKEAVRNRNQLPGEILYEIDYISCKNNGSSYRLLPSRYKQPACSGRNDLCNQVLNDRYVSFPIWSEDPSNSTVACRKTFYEEQMYRCEDERFELDHAISTCSDTLAHMESLQAHIDTLSPEEKVRFRLDEKLNGQSEILYWQTIRRAYGDKVDELYKGLRDNPFVAVPVLIRRLRIRREEWKSAQNKFNHHWSAVVDNYYFKSLDIQGIGYRKQDTNYIRTKNLVNEILSISEENKHILQSGIATPRKNESHMSLDFSSIQEVLPDIVSLLLYHMTHQNNLSAHDSKKMKILIKEFIPEFFSVPPLDIGDEEDLTGEEDSGEDQSMSDVDNSDGKSTADSKEEIEVLEPKITRSKTSKDSNLKPKLFEEEKPGEDIKTPILSPVFFKAPAKDISEAQVKLMFANNIWYSFFRLLQIFIERLTLFKNFTKTLIDNPDQDSVNSATDFPDTPTVQHYYDYLLKYVCCMLDGMFDASFFEEKLRRMFTVNAFKAYSMDRIVQNLCRQLQRLVSDDVCTHCYDVYRQNKANLSRTPPELPFLGTYQREVEEEIYGEDNCFRIVYNKGLMSIDLLERSEESEPEDPETAAFWTYYIDEYLHGEVNEELLEEATSKPVFLRRNLSKAGHLDLSMVEDNKNLYAFDMEEVRFEPLNYRMKYVTHSGFSLYWKGSLAYARDTHKIVSEKKMASFLEWQRKWVYENISSDQMGDCRIWFMGNEDSPHHVECITESDSERAPYYPFSKYRIVNSV